MNKVYVVIEEYYFDGTETHIEIFGTLEKANEHFNRVVERECATTWIDEDCDIEREEKYFHAYDPSNYYETTIYIEEKEIL